MRILFFHANIANYLTDGLMLGLRKLGNVEVVDLPRMDYLYGDATAAMLQKTGSGGRTLYGGLQQETDSVKSSRIFWQRELDSYDLFVFADISHTADIFQNIYRKLGSSVAKKKMVSVDGYDQPQRFPYFNRKERMLHTPWQFLYATNRVRYFKREGQNRKTLPISMSIPSEAIEEIAPAAKTQEFVGYNVDPELADWFPMQAAAPLGQRHFVFETEEDYNAELRRSRFGITTKRAGWDCLRHYEYAAKGVVLCFRDLDKKPVASAPHGLDFTNCIIYHSAAHLRQQIDALTPEAYARLQEGGYAWVRRHTTVEVAKRFLEAAGFGLP